MTQPFCTNHSVRMISSETFYASQFASMQDLSHIAKEVYTFGCLHCGYRRELIQQPKKSKTA